MSLKKAIIGLGGKERHEEVNMICMEVQKLYGLASEIEGVAVQCQDENRKKRLIALADKLICIADDINIEVECAED